MLRTIIDEIEPMGLIPEFQFDDVRKWRFDYAWPELLVAVEYEGNIYARANAKGHRSIGKFVADLEKYNSAAIAGWCLIRVGVVEVNNGSAARWIRQAIELRAPHVPAFQVNWGPPAWVQELP